VEFARASRRDQPAERRESFVDLTKEAAVASENKPAIQDLRVDGLGNLWVTHWRPMWEEGALQTFSVFGPDGVWLGDLTAPPGIKLTDIGDDYVLVTWTDETEIPYVRLFPLIKN